MRRCGSLACLAACGALALAGALASEVVHAAPAPAVTGAAPSKHRTYTLAECLALADKNHPTLWAARARLANSHAQLEEANWTPFSQWSGNASLSSIANVRGAAPYTSSTASGLNTSFEDGFNPWFRMGISGGIPVYTFGKIEWISRAAEAQIRAGEWEAEKFRRQIRADVRRAYYGAMFGRDVHQVFDEVIPRLGKIIDLIETKIANGDPSADESSRIRLDILRDTLNMRSGEPDKRSLIAMSTLRFMTGVQTDFDIVPTPFVRPEVTISPVVTYLTAARLNRPEINQARSGIAARRAQLEYAKAKLFPDIALAFTAGINLARSAVIQNGWVSNPFNSNGFYFGGPILVSRWAPDLMPGLARIDIAAAQLEEMRATERLALGGVAVEVENAYGVVLETRQREERFAHSERITRKWLDDTQAAIEQGKKDGATLTEPLTTYLDQRSNHLTAILDYGIALSELAKVTGWEGATLPTN